jgi:hypothetical protein
MEMVILAVSAALMLFGLYRFIKFRLKLKNYNRTKAEVTNMDVETRYYIQSQYGRGRGSLEEITKEEYDQFLLVGGHVRTARKFSPELTYTAEDGNTYTGTWWTDTPGSLPFNIGERIEIYYSPADPRKFFMFDKMMMVWEPVILYFIGLIGVIFLMQYV